MVQKTNKSRIHRKKVTKDKKDCLVAEWLNRTRCSIGRSYVP